MTRRSEEAEGKHTVRPHRLERSGDVVLADSGVLHVAKVAQKGEGAEASFDQAAAPSACACLRRWRAQPPRCREWRARRRETLPQLGLRRVARTSVAEEEDVAQTHSTGAVVLRKRVLVEAGEGGRKALLHRAASGVRPSAQ